MNVICPAIKPNPLNFRFLIEMARYCYCRCCHCYNLGFGRKGVQRVSGAVTSFQLHFIKVSSIFGFNSKLLLNCRTIANAINRMELKRIESNRSGADREEVEFPLLQVQFHFQFRFHNHVHGTRPTPTPTPSEFEFNGLVFRLVNSICVASFN